MILLENSCVGFNSDWDWLFCNCCHKLCSRICWNLGVVGYFNLSLILWFLASLGQSSVYISTFKIFWFWFSMNEGIWLPSSIASIWCSVTVNKLLFWKWKEISSGNEVSSFNGSSSWEGPAWSALGLVFNWVYCTLGSPVDWISEVISFKIGWLFHVRSWWIFESIQFLCLIFGHGWEFVVTNYEVLFSGIDFIDFSIFLFV